MKTLILPGLVLLFASVLRAQFYAPETEFHDPCQRTFPVEAARVLSWQQNAAGAAIAEVTYQLETVDGSTVWHLQWLDAQKKPLREKTVRYAPALLLEGPKFFREVFRQLEGDDWLPKSESPGSLEAPFWEGAERAGVSRLDSLAAAGGQISRVPHVTRAADAARLAGTLAHGAMPLFGNTVTLDSLLLSRASAWLCLAEQLSGKPANAVWAPILFLAHRERFACATWQAAGPSADGDRGDAGRFWEFLLHTPSTKSCFLFAAQKGNRQFALPSMLYPAQFDTTWMTLLVNVADEVIVPRLYEYGPHISMRGRAGGGGDWGRLTGVAMRTWLDATTAFEPPPHDFTGYQPILKQAAKAVDAAGNDETTAIKALAPALNLGLDEGRGPLIPVATATARDLLGYGWEMAGLQYGYSYDFLANMGDEKAAGTLANVVLGEVKGLEAFFRQHKIAAHFPLDDLRRLQFVDSSLVDAAFSQKLPSDWRNPPERYLSRRWLIRGGISGIEMLIRNGGRAEEVRIFVERMRQEGGPVTVCNLVNHDANTKFPAFIDVLDLREKLLADLPWNFRERARMANQPGKARAFESARNLEQLGWEALTFPNSYVIFSNYVTGNAEDSARRFYDEAHPFIVANRDFPSLIGPARYALAWIDHDEATERRVIQDCRTPARSDLHLEFIHAILHGQYDEARQDLDGLLSMSGDESNESNKVMKEYLPLIPALLNVGDADHPRALEAFPKDKGWYFLRWAIARQAALPPEEVVRLFHDQTNGPEGLFAAAAWGDKAHFDPFRALYVKVALDPMEQILIAHEFVKQQGTKPQKKQPDLKPVGARPLDELIREEVR